MTERFDRSTPLIEFDDARWAHTLDVLGRRLCAAFLSYQMSATLQTGEKYVKDIELGSYWTELAKRVIQEHADLANASHVQRSR